MHEKFPARILVQSTLWLGLPLGKVSRRQADHNILTWSGLKTEFSLVAFGFSA